MNIIPIGSKSIICPKLAQIANDLIEFLQVSELGAEIDKIDYNCNNYTAPCINILLTYKLIEYNIVLHDGLIEMRWDTESWIEFPGEWYSVYEERTCGWLIDKFTIDRFMKTLEMG